MALVSDKQRDALRVCAVLAITSVGLCAVMHVAGPDGSGYREHCGMIFTGHLFMLSFAVDMIIFCLATYQEFLQGDMGFHVYAAPLFYAALAATVNLLAWTLATLAPVIWASHPWRALGILYVVSVAINLGNLFFAFMLIGW